MHPTALLFAVHQVGVHVTLSVVLFFGNFGGQNQQRITPLQGTGGSLCIFPRHQPYRSLCRGRACPAGAISVSKNHILAPLNV